MANITVPLVGMVDIAIAGHLSSAFGSAALIGGIAVGTMLFDLLYWNFAFLRTGTGGLTAQAFGASHATGPILLRALRIALLSGLALIAIQWLVVQGAFLVVKCTPEVRQLASQYFYIRIWAAPATLSLFAFKGWFIGMQDSVRPMTADLLVNGINILASFLLALGIPGIFDGLGFPGIALGTVIAQWSGFAYCILAARRRYFVHGNLDTESGSFFNLNRDLFLRSLGMIAVYIGFTVISARFGDLMLAVSTILMKLLMIFSYFTDGFAYAGEALTGRFIGAKSEDGVRSTVRQTFAWSGGVAVLFMALYGLGGTWLFSLMTSDSTVVDAGREFIPWLLLMPLIGCAAFVWDGIFIGATQGRHLRNSTLICAVGFFGVWFAGRLIAPEASPEMALHILMGAYFVHLAIRTVYLTCAWPRILTR
ncbi:MAG: MATE family efflux transporter [Bacteroidales bacterium]|nr:MATE family efflux transporter [Bacteroidales bacterium]